MKKVKKTIIEVIIEGVEVMDDFNPDFYREYQNDAISMARKLGLNDEEVRNFFRIK